MVAIVWILGLTGKTLKVATQGQIKGITYIYSLWLNNYEFVLIFGHVHIPSIISHEDLAVRTDIPVFFSKFPHFPSFLA